MLAAVSDRTKLIFICSPGNPTCKAIPLSDVEKIASATEQYQGLVVVDEAYVDFSTLGSAVSLIQKYPNVVVLQTLSKAFGLAGIRWFLLGIARCDSTHEQCQGTLQCEFHDEWSGD